MKPNKKLKTAPKTFHNVAFKRVQFNLTSREDHADYKLMLKAKELFALLAKDTKQSRPALLFKLVSSFALTGNFTANEKQLINAAATHEGVSIEEFNRRSVLLYANKILKQTDQDMSGSQSSSNGNGSSFVAKPTSKADLKVSRIVAEMMLHNDNATCWQDKREITARSVNDWGKHADTLVAYKSFYQPVLKRYFMLHRETIQQHHLKHNIKPGHNRRAVTAAKQKSC